ncbi:hypothetical protein KC19_VG321800 [Ceratodon purpureus]|uniref:Uncharacterized protein n=1 Tax=Ceratodon purpureus TaxID=3225 RepID=A0A8T0HWI3_CERPU|nr:hypothetical protein KC19_VG321800 [Ceratodon purpureus]
MHLFPDSLLFFLLALSRDLLILLFFLFFFLLALSRGLLILLFFLFTISQLGRCSSFTFCRQYVQGGSFRYFGGATAQQIFFLLCWISGSLLPLSSPTSIAH